MTLTAIAVQKAMQASPARAMILLQTIAARAKAMRLTTAIPVVAATAVPVRHQVVIAQQVIVLRLRPKQTEQHGAPLEERRAVLLGLQDVRPGPQHVIIDKIKYSSYGTCTLVSFCV